MKGLEKRIAAAVKRLEKLKVPPPELALVLGSGLGDLAERIEGAVAVPYGSIPSFPVSTVEGHAGQLVLGTLHGKRVAAMQGRFHYYEGYPLSEVTLPIRVLRALGAGTLIVTNAAGAVNREFAPGDLMLIEDHLNLQGDNPLIGPNLKDFGPRFPDMSSAYTPELRTAAREAAAEQGIALRSGVYACLSGPSYETPAEIRMLRTLGADAVGMSTVPEVIVASHAGMRVLGISCLTNMAAGVLDQPLNHAEVIETSARVRGDFIRLMEAVIRRC